jgi:type I restriction enzyme M protein
MQTFDVEFSEDGKIVDFLSAQLLESKPEEIVRQRFLRILHFEYGYAKNVMRKEVPIHYGSKELIDASGNPVRADIVIYDSATACAARDQGRIALVVECKAPTESDGYSQLVSYVFNTSASGGVWFNGSGRIDEIRYYRRLFDPENGLVPWVGIPRPNEAWDALGRRKKSDLRRPKDIKGLLRRCHNKLHGRGVEGEEEDLTMDMVRIILSKAMDEESEKELPDFYCTPEEYNTDAGREIVAARIHILFEQVKASNPQVFSDYERITVGNRAICDVVIELQSFQLLSDLTKSDDWDIMGYAYEEYTSTYLKRKKGQFFTNRLVIDFMVSALSPDQTDIVLDPAGGSGGFITGALRYVRKQVLASQSSEIGRRNRLDRFRRQLYMIDISHRLVKVAKTAMILNGDGHTGITQGDSLGDYRNFNQTIRDNVGLQTPTIILTNPPFAGVGEGRITDRDTLERFVTSKKWIYSNNEYMPTDQIIGDGIPPELLFFERCIDWLAPGGKLGIVMPKSFLDTATYLTGRYLLFRKCRLLGVINCHKNTFQPHTGVRTCLILLQKHTDGEITSDDYPIFMAISKKIGQDSEGAPTYKRDKDGEFTDQIDHDLEEVLEAYRHLQSGQLKASEYCFSIRRSQINGELRINPQAFLPSLNKTLQAITRIDERETWSVTTLGQIVTGIEIFKGPRFKSENILVEEPGEKANTEPYFTPSAILQEKSDSVKWVDLTLASEKQLRTIKAIRVYRGDIVITRSGTIGRVVYITEQHDNAIASDDLIRVRIADENIRYYVYYYLQTKYAYDQMLMNEYGAVQQHLEPEHVRDMLVPVPDDWNQVSDIVDMSRKTIELKEQLYKTSRDASNRILTLIDGLSQ